MAKATSQFKSNGHGDKPLHKRGKTRDQIKSHLLHTDPTRDYNSTQFNFYGELFVQNLPQWRLWTGRMMLTSDPVVNFALNVRNAALMPAEVIVTAKNPKVKKWVEEQWNYLWNQHRSKLVAAKKMGFAALQILFKMKEGLLCIKGVKDFAPEDCRALEQGGILCGHRVKGDKMFFPQALWLTYAAEHGGSYGYGCLRRSYPAWYEKWMNHGAKRLLQLRMIKDAYVGDIFWYPPNMLIELPNGDQMPWKDVLRELGENRFSGGSMTLPRLLDSQGKELTGYTPPQSIAGTDIVFQWVEYCDQEILRGADIPMEVVKASDTGSGYSGRSIPFLVVLSNCTQELTEIVQRVTEQVLRPMAWLNWGGEVEFEVTPKSLVESFSKDTSGSAMGGSAIGSQAGQGPPQLQQPPGAVQFAESEHFQILNKHGWETTAPGGVIFRHRSLPNHTIHVHPKRGNFVHKVYNRDYKGAGKVADLHSYLSGLKTSQHSEQEHQWRTNDELAAKAHAGYKRVYPNAKLQHVPVKDIHLHLDFRQAHLAETDPKGGRKHVNKLAQLMKSGTHLPPGVGHRRADGKIHLADGHHRLSAAKKLGIKHIPVMVDESGESQHSEDSLPGGKGDNADPSKFSKEQIQAGIKVELEHTDDPKVALEIVLDHLTEDDQYYTKLAKVEPDAKKALESSQHSELSEEVEEAAKETEKPTSEEQAEAGNYKKGKVNLHGLTISIENAKGTKRKPEWPPLSAHYGYINRTEGKDGDHVDVFIGPCPESEVIYVIDQTDKSGEKFDEHKCVLGTYTEEDARELYLGNYPQGWKCGPITAMTVDQFKAWLEDGNTKKPVAGQVAQFKEEVPCTPFRKQ